MPIRFYQGWPNVTRTRTQTRGIAIIDWMQMQRFGAIENAEANADAVYSNASSRVLYPIFSDAPTHCYKRVCLSIRPLRLLKYAFQAHRIASIGLVSWEYVVQPSLR